MNKLLILTAFLFLFMLGSVANASIVDEIKSYSVGEEIYINLNDGTIVVGRILEIGDDAVKIIGDLGELTIKYSKIKQVSNDMFAPADV